MADIEDPNDEYQFTDLDTANPDDGASDPLLETSSSERNLMGSENNVKRNALIVVGAIVLVMILYKLLGSFFAAKPAAETSIVPMNTSSTVAVQAPTQPLAVVSEEVPVPQEPQINKQVSAIELRQQTLRSEVTSVTDQLNSISNNVDNLSTKMAELNAALLTLSSKVDIQAREIAQLTTKRTAVRRASVSVRRPSNYARYSLQAVIPGRAWLIATNGATLTVREGSMIAGYGMVKLIDPNQGRVITSSGQVIKFSQDDS